MNTTSVKNPDELLPTRRSLIERLRDLDDQASWREFFDMYWKLLYGAAIRAGLSDQEAEDVVQETVIGVARKMETLRYDPAVCSFKGWLMRVTRCRIADQFRRRRPQNVPLAAPRAETTTEPSLNVRDPSADVLEDIWDQEWQKNLVDVAMERVRRRANPALPDFSPARRQGPGRARRREAHWRQPRQGVCDLSSHRETGQSRRAPVGTNCCPCLKIDA
jgi:RNA polymerase sigma-70 factor (ECF subfamily)